MTVVNPFMRVVLFFIMSVFVGKMEGMDGIFLSLFCRFAEPVVCSCFVDWGAQAVEV